jgi:hypothetical protein
VTLEKYECVLDSEDVKDGVVTKTFQTDDGNWHWIAIRIRDCQPVATCCHIIKEEVKPS